MAGLKSYLSPSRASKRRSQQPSIEMSSSPSSTLSATPRSSPLPPSHDLWANFSSAYDSPHPVGDFRNGTTKEITDIKCEVMVQWLHARQEELLWTTGEEDEGVVLKKRQGEYSCAPAELRHWTGAEGMGFLEAVAALNVRVAMTLNTRVIRIVLQANDMPYIEIERGLRIQVLPDMACLPRCQKHQYAAFIANRGTLVVWDDDPRKIVGRVERLQTLLMKMIWRNESAYPQESEKKAPQVEVAVAEVDSRLESCASEKPRRVLLYQSVLVAITLALVIAALGTGFRQVALEIAVDSNMIRIAFVLCLLPQIWLALFFFQALTYNFAQILGPISQVKQNSKFYSGVAPVRLNRANGPLPHVTIQCPVYKEGLHSVIEPTIRSIKAAISTYEMQGGTANIFVNDDGMQLLSEAQAEARQDFYEEHNIGWVARPKHNPSPADGNGEKAFVRRGKFKKASNMNYALWVSQRVEEKLDAIQRYRHAGWTQDDESVAYRNALADVIAEDEGRTWADGNIRMGDYILLIDSDTRVPSDCLLDAVSELEHSPEVAVLQQSSGVMNVTTSFFERGITFFTNLVYTQIRFAVACGDVAPFVGHNAVLRWSAVQEVAYACPDDDGREKYWSEATVSEDFDIALRLQTAGYVVRLGAYSENGFKEGVSLTVYDELARWEKYAYGCNELLFHPLRYWPTRGPFTPLFRRFIWSAMPLPSKVTILAYIGTYYALGSSWAFTLANYFLIGWYNGRLDHYYVDSWKVVVAVLVVFSALGNFALAVLRYRTSERALLPALWENVCWVPMLLVFLGGVSLHVSQALLSHFFGVDMQWGATSKEAENVTFWQEIPRVLKRFKGTLVFCVGCAAMMVYLANWAPVGWRIEGLIAVWPLTSVVLCHFLLPVALNPNLMRFTW